MNVKIGLSVQNTDGMKFDFGGKNLTNEEYQQMLNAQAMADIDRYNGIRNVYTDNSSVIESNNDTFAVVDMDGVLLDADKSDTITQEFLDDKVSDERMSILILNLRPCDSIIEDDIDDDIFSQLQDAESEIRYWVKDSMLVWNSEKLSDEEKLLSSPEKDLYVTLDNGEKYSLRNCKVFEEYTTKNNPMYFAIIVEKITR